MCLSRCQVRSLPPVSSGRRMSDLIHNARMRVTLQQAARQQSTALRSPWNRGPDTAAAVSAATIGLRGRDRTCIGADVLAIVAGAAEAARLRQRRRPALKPHVVPARHHPGMAGIPRLELAVVDRL